jgi:hypothetical protein
LTVVLADVAPFDVTGNSLPEEHGELCTRALQDGFEFGAVCTGESNHQQRAHRSLELRLEPVDHHIDVGRFDPDRIGEVLPVEALADVKVEERPILGRQAFRCAPHQLLEAFNICPVVAQYP